MPVQQAAVESDEHWADSRTYFVGNGPFRRGGDWTDHHRLTLQKQDNHYDAKRIVPDRVELVLQTEEQARINAGRVDVVIGAANEPTGNGGDPTVGLLLVNGMSTNLERDGLRRALSLAIDRNALAADLGGSYVAADGLIPAASAPARGRTSAMPTARLSTTTRRATATAAPRAATELHQAGYTSAAAMEQLGTVTLLYDSGSGQAALARQLQQMWRETLGLQVTLQGVSNEEYLQLLTDGAYTLALTELTAACNDAAAYLEPWRSSDARNYALHMNAYDILMRVAAASTSAEARDAYLKDAEQLLLDSGNIIPLYSRQQPYQIREGVAGAVNDGLGAWYFGSVRRVTQ